ncbi:hypothetical protein [Rhodococcus qingshengii]|uniref:hypothetical protein n=1 Tax=Rhodococcus qingshengii TaxID=334542 RepID=UPI0035D5ED81
MRRVHRCLLVRGSWCIHPWTVIRQQLKQDTYLIKEKNQMLLGIIFTGATGFLLGRTTFEAEQYFSNRHLNVYTMSVLGILYMVFQTIILSFMVFGDEMQAYLNMALGSCVVGQIVLITPMVADIRSRHRYETLS